MISSSFINTPNGPGVRNRRYHEVFIDPVVGGAVLDRMVSSAIKLISTAGNSYRKEVMGNPTRSSAKSTVKGLR